MMGCSRLMSGLHYWGRSLVYFQNDERCVKQEAEPVPLVQSRQEGQEAY